MLPLHNPAIPSLVACSGFHFYVVYGWNKNMQHTVMYYMYVSISICSKYFAAIYTVNKTETYQEIIGFGGAFTDAAGINIASLSKGAQENLLKSYYSPDGNATVSLVY